MASPIHSTAPRSPSSRCWASSRFAFHAPSSIKSDPFAAPYDTFEEAYQASTLHTQDEAQQGEAYVPGEGAGEGIRDPRRENFVGDLDLSAAERKKAQEQADRDGFHEEVQERCTQVDVGELYLLQLEVAEHGVNLGLAMVQKKVPAKEEWTVIWFKLSSRAWLAANPAFVPYYVNKKLQTAEFDIKSFRLHVTPSAHEPDLDAGPRPSTSQTTTITTTTTPPAPLVRPAPRPQVPLSALTDGAKATMTPPATPGEPQASTRMRG